MHYDPSNIFAKILAGELPCHEVYRDETAVAMMDIFPQSKGHVLVIPRDASRNLIDADPATLSALMPLVQRLAKAVLSACAADGLKLVQFNEAPAGQTVFHLHFHLIPVYEGRELGTHHGGKRAEDAELAALARQIAAKL